MAVYFDSVQVAGGSIIGQLGCVISSEISAILDLLSAIYNIVDNHTSLINDIGNRFSNSIGNYNALDIGSTLEFSNGCSCLSTPYDCRVYLINHIGSIFVDDKNVTYAYKDGISGGVMYSGQLYVDIGAGSKLDTLGRTGIIPFRYGLKNITDTYTTTSSCYDLFNTEDKGESFGLKMISALYKEYKEPEGYKSGDWYYSAGFYTLDTVSVRNISSWNQDISLLTRYYDGVSYTVNNYYKITQLARRNLTIRMVLQNVSQKNILLKINIGNITGHGTDSHYNDEKIGLIKDLYSFTWSHKYSVSNSPNTEANQTYNGGYIILPENAYLCILTAVKSLGYVGESLNTLYQNPDLFEMSWIDQTTPNLIFKSIEKTNEQLFFPK